MKYPLYETSYIKLKNFDGGMVEIRVVTIYYSDGSINIKEVPGPIHLFEKIGIINE